jgi:hypothetical protein
MNNSIKMQVSDEEWKARVDLAACYRIVAMYGWDDLVFTHISARVPGGDGQQLGQSRPRRGKGPGFTPPRKPGWVRHS